MTDFETIKQMLDKVNEQYEIGPSNLVIYIGSTTWVFKEDGSLLFIQRYG